MSVVIRYLKRAFMILALLITIVIVVAVIFVRTASFGRLLKTQVDSALANSFRGRITLGQIETSIWGTLSIHELRIENRMMGLHTRITAPGIPPADLFSDVAYRDANGPPRLTIDKLLLKTQASTVSVAGVIRNLQTLDSTVAITVDRLAAADLSSLV